MAHKVYLAHSLQIHNPYTNPPGGVEYTYMREIAMKAAYTLRQRGVEVRLPDPNWRFLPDYQYLDRMAAASNAFGAELYLSIHSNAGAFATQGALTFYFPGSTKGRVFAANVELQVSLISPSKRDGIADIRTSSSLHDLNTPHAPAALCEVGFHTNPIDAKDIAAHPEHYAQALADAVCITLRVPILENEGKARMLKSDAIVLGHLWKLPVDGVSASTDIIGAPGIKLLRAIADEAERKLK